MPVVHSRVVHPDHMNICAAAVPRTSLAQVIGDQYQKTPLQGKDRPNFYLFPVHIELVGPIGP